MMPTPLEHRLMVVMSPRMMVVMSPRKMSTLVSRLRSPTLVNPRTQMILTLGGDSPTIQFHTEAARVIMKVMYAARMARPDLIRAISFLARFLTKWSDDLDKRLHRLMSYVHHSYAYRMYAWAGADQGECSLDVYSDSDYAGCSETQCSTTGSIVFLRSNGMSIPISFISTRQSSVPRSTVEVEIVAMDTSLRVLRLPVLSIVEEFSLQLWFKFTDIINPCCVF